MMKIYMKTRFHSDGQLYLNKAIKIPSLVKVVKPNFIESNNYYPQPFLDECLHKL